MSQLLRRVSCGWIFCSGKKCEVKTTNDGLLRVDLNRGSYKSSGMFWYAYAEHTGICIKCYRVDTTVIVSITRESKQ